MKRNVRLRRSTKPIARRTRPRAVRKGKRASLERNLRQLVAVAAFARDNHTCQVQGFIAHRCKGPLDPAHGFGKGSHPSVEFEPWNVIAVCRFMHDGMGTSSKTWTRFLWWLWGWDLYSVRYAAACQKGRDLAEIRAELVA